MSSNTRTRILVASLTLFNENGVSHTTTNEIADEVDISPGNLHYHFRKKSDLVDALLAEFQADARRVLRPPHSEPASLDDFWVFLHFLLELKAAYGFLLRDLDSLLAEFPKAGVALKHFTRGVIASFELYLHALGHGVVVPLSNDEAAIVARNLTVITLFSDRLSGLLDDRHTPDTAALQTAAGVLSVLRPLVAAGAAEHLEELLSHYGSR
ncbi:MAG: TetR/AcrR family transcriptional regulator [Gammaproteobacteria bacterium]|nr:TetR/AcrR family transcriptional regulator [Gammaproteobacteria bacterium]